MTRRTLLQTACSSAPALLLQTNLNAQGGAPPNILFLYTDDQSRWSLPSYGSREAHAPHIERIAREGAVCEQAFVTSPVCSPSRASLLTSQYSFRSGIHDFIDVRREPELGLSEDFPTWPQLLQQHGYRTALFGKWHLGTRPEHHPTRRGYHEFMGFLEGGNTPMDPWLEVNGKESKITGSLPDLLADSTIDFLKRTKGTPFLASVHFRAPHAPYGPVPPQDSAALDGKAGGLTKEMLAYYRSIASVDRNVGRILDELDSLGLSGNTLVIFTSDNGYMVGQHDAHGKGNATRMSRPAERVPNMYDDSMLTPLLIRWPGVVKPGSRIPQMISHLDFFPTLLRAAGASHLVPEGFTPCGRDFTPLLRGETVPWRDVVFGDYDMYHYLKNSMRMIRTARWKLVTHSHENYQHELYDLENDPGEKKNLIGAPEHAATMRQLRRRLQAWQQWNGDPRRG